MCLRHADDGKNSLCELAFQCQRSFTGVSVLVRRTCATCHRPNATPCACRTLSFCSPTCADRARDVHGPVCALVKAHDVATETEVLRLL